MSALCAVPADQICWEPPTDVLCDPCVDLESDAGLAEFQVAWKYASSYMYRQMQTKGHHWPGECFVERARPCIPKCMCPIQSKCGCGSYNYLSLTDAGFCLPIVELLAVNIFGGECCPCNETTVLRPVDGHIRMERVDGEHRIVRQRNCDGCCPQWWPQQDLCQPDCGDCTWSIDVRTGCNPPPDVLAATGGLAIEIIKECQQHGCHIAEGATRVTTSRGTTFERDPNQIASGFWWSMMKDILDRDPVPVESFAAPDWCRSVEWHHVFGPSRYGVDGCEIVLPGRTAPYGVDVCGWCARTGPCGCGFGEVARFIDQATCTVHGDSPCTCDETNFAEVAKAVGGYSPGFG